MDDDEDDDFEVLGTDEDDFFFRSVAWCCELDDEDDADWTAS